MNRAIFFITLISFAYTVNESKFFIFEAKIQFFRCMDFDTTLRNHDIYKVLLDGTLDDLSCILLLVEDKKKAMDYFIKVTVEKVCYNEHFLSVAKVKIVKDCEEFLPKCGRFFWERIFDPAKFNLKTLNLKLINGDIYFEEDNQYFLLLSCSRVEALYSQF
ncbi:uncharacterized protein LOC126906875 isoform X2 [Daktulosphaira vitifoliae]|uniref:uncharacterized protein LOC126906875 isoform X2 n=1 Tax=Daktulosphaira vitifoliae TaxID=58002 RepID=UPI0021AAA435|nr:uncharacterized protein LOC126906875 isoform X2 [Daktulosphaira vitifoliae]